MNASAAERHSSSKPVLESYLEVGYNYRMTDVQAAIGLVQLGKLDAMIARRRELAARYDALLRDVPGLTPYATRSTGRATSSRTGCCWTRTSPSAGTTCWARSPTAGVSARRGIMASHLEPAYEGHPSAPLPVTERISRDSLILPLFHTLTEDQQDRVVAALREQARG